jgi:hypothetical protein
MILYVASILDQREKYKQLVLMMHGILMQDNKSSLVFVAIVDLQDKIPL